MRRAMVVAVLATAVILLASCGGGSGGGGAGAAPAKVGIVYSKTGLLASYGAEYRAGFEAGLDYATHGTGSVNGHHIEVSWRDGASDPAKAVSAAKDLIGKGYQIIAGPTDSAVSLQIASVAEQNKILYISGPAATDGITGINRYTFRSGRQTYQDVKTAAAIIGDPAGKSVLVFAQDYAFGQANVKAVKAVLGGAGAKVDALLAPVSASDFTPFAQKIKNRHPDLLFVAWAGSSTTSMWQTLDRQGVFKQTTVVTGLGDRASFDAYGKAASKVDFLSYYFPDAPQNSVNDAMIQGVKKQGEKTDLFTPDGFVAAQMVVHALSATKGEPDVDTMISALEGWTFTAPKGKETIRRGDHAMVQAMYVARLTRHGNGYTPKLVRRVPADQVAPPVAK